MPHDLSWFIIVAAIGVILGSLATFFFRASAIRNIVTGGFVALGIALVAQWFGVKLPFEPWLRQVAENTVGAMGSFLGQIVKH